MNNNSYPLTIYYDASCPLCAEEMQRLKQRDPHNRLQLVDCSAPGFTPPIGAPEPARMLERLHARTADGHWAIGVPAFQLAYAAAGFDFVADWMQRPGIARMLQLTYPLIARMRHWIPACFAAAWFNWLARRADQRSGACANGQCRL